MVCRPPGNPVLYFIQPGVPGKKDAHNPVCRTGPFLRSVSIVPAVGHPEASESWSVVVKMDVFIRSCCGGRLPLAVPVDAGRSHGVVSPLNKRIFHTWPSGNCPSSEDKFVPVSENRLSSEDKNVSDSVEWPCPGLGRSPHTLANVQPLFNKTSD